MVFVTAILQDACLSIKVSSLFVQRSAFDFPFWFFPPRWPATWLRERWEIFCSLLMLSLLSEMIFSNISFQTDRVCWFAGWPCRMFCSNLCLSERNASGRLSRFESNHCFVLNPLQLLDRRRRERGRDDPGGDPRGQRGELHRQERHPHNLQDWRESRNWLRRIIVAKIVKEYTYYEICFWHSLIMIYIQLGFDRWESSLFVSVSFFGNT